MDAGCERCDVILFRCGDDAAVGNALTMEALKILPVARQDDATEGVGSCENHRVGLAEVAVFLGRQHIVAFLTELEDDRVREILIRIEPHAGSLRQPVALIDCFVLADGLGDFFRVRRRILPGGV